MTPSSLMQTVSTEKWVSCLGNFAKRFAVLGSVFTGATGPLSSHPTVAFSFMFWNQIAAVLLLSRANKNRGKMLRQHRFTSLNYCPKKEKNRTNRRDWAKRRGIFIRYIVAFGFLGKSKPVAEEMCRSAPHRHRTINYLKFISLIELHGTRTRPFNKESKI